MLALAHSTVLQLLLNLPAPAGVFLELGSGGRGAEKGDGSPLVSQTEWWSAERTRLVWNHLFGVKFSVCGDLTEPSASVINNNLYLLDLGTLDKGEERMWVRGCRESVLGEV